MKKKHPTKEQIKHLQNYRHIHGRYWKSHLRQDWITGHVGDPVLQQIRNEFGPTWLTNFKLPD